MWGEAGTDFAKHVTLQSSHEHVVSPCPNPIQVDDDILLADYLILISKKEIEKRSDVGMNEKNKGAGNKDSSE